jgi:UDP-N-acetylglucosamine 2-epimerase (non-hydrolysing)/GDP/UDP-N,N'-diacetylbacillosamine 2-epimerase (hydrolysing)
VAKKIAIITGKRGGLGALSKIIDGIASEPAMELFLIATDMHLSNTFGHTIDEVKAKIRVDAVIDLGEYGDMPLDRTIAMGNLVAKLANVLEENRPDVVLLLGDRGETLAAAMCAVEMGIVVAHIQAGDISGGIDDLHRHSITKLAHLHFSQNETQRQRVIKLGESADRVWNVGAPYVDNILNGDLLSRDEALRVCKLKIEKEYFIVLQHSDSYRPNISYDHTKAILEVMESREEDAVIIYPCSDPGYKQVIKALNEFRGNPRFHFFRNIEAIPFLSLLKKCKALIGNSSGGIIEAPYMNIPFINVGLRQEGREKADNTYSCDGKFDEIQGALKVIETKEFRKRMAADIFRFGDGHASERILNILLKVELTPELFRKRITY